MKELEGVQDPVNWKDDIIPGCYFLRFITKAEAAVYGVVIAESTDPAFRLTKSYSRHQEAQGLGRTPVASVTMLLSREQFEIARSLGWPADEHGLRKVLLVPAN